MSLVLDVMSLKGQGGIKVERPRRPFDVQIDGGDVCSLVNGPPWHRFSLSPLHGCCPLDLDTCRFHSWFIRKIFLQSHSMERLSLAVILFETTAANHLVNNLPSCFIQKAPLCFSEFS